MATVTNTPFTAGQQPTTAFWNNLWANDVGLGNGTMITNLEVGSQTAVKSDYKFSAYLTAAHNLTNTSAVIPFDTESFDTSSNFDSVTNKGRFTAPVAGFYEFRWSINLPNVNQSFILSLNKNGSSTALFNIFQAQGTTSSDSVSAGTSPLIQLASNDYIEMWGFCNATEALVTGATNCVFSGNLFSTT